MAKYQAAVLGCGSIFSRHLAALQANSNDYEFVGYFDPDVNIQSKLQNELPLQKCYSSEDELFNDTMINCVIILTPSDLHFSQASRALNSGCNVILEKPACLDPNQIISLIELANSLKLEIFCVLQVRLNQSVDLVKQVLDEGLLGEIRSSSLIQRWQRPESYFSGWRGTYAGCGGVMSEFGIHYLDIMQYLLGTPEVTSTKFYKTKFKISEVDDSVYALLDFGTFGATMEICLAAEPHNIEVSLTILGSNGYLKLGGKSLDQVVAVEFLTQKNLLRYEQICQEVLGYKIDNQVEIGACPHHPELYKQIVVNPERFSLVKTYNILKLISKINQMGQA